MSEDLEQKLNLIESYFESGDTAHLVNVVADLKAADVAAVLSALTLEQGVVLFDSLAPELASDVLAILDEGLTRELLDELDDSVIVRSIDLMASDDATDIVTLLKPERINEILGKISRKDYEDVRELLKFDEESAGGLMAREVMAVRSEAKISEIIELLKPEAEKIEHIQNIYVVDGNRVLLGIIPIVKLLVVDRGKKAEEVMERDIVTVAVNTDQEEVAAIFAKYDLYSLPVVDENGRLAGRITVDDIIDVIEEEATEDIKIMAGTGQEEFWEKSSVRVSRARLPWLLTGLFGGIGAALVMNYFRGSLESVLTLAFFVPVVTAMGGNVGIQSSAIVVRELAVGGGSLVRTSQKLLRELRVSLINGLVLGSVLLLTVTLWQKDYRLGALLGICLLVIVLWATLMGAIVPLMLKKINVDPALATGPFITTSNDILGLLIYLGVATLFLDWVGGG